MRVLVQVSVYLRLNHLSTGLSIRPLSIWLGDSLQQTGPRQGHGGQLIRPLGGRKHSRGFTLFSSHPYLNINAFMATSSYPSIKGNAPNYKEQVFMAKLSLNGFNQFQGGSCDLVCVQKISAECDPCSVQFFSVKAALQNVESYFSAHMVRGFDAFYKPH